MCFFFVSWREYLCLSKQECEKIQCTALKEEFELKMDSSKRRLVFQNHNVTVDG